MGAAPHPAGPAPGAAASPLPPADPVELRIDAIGATSTLIPLGLNSDDTIEVPPVGDPMQAGWYRYGPAPGELGPAVILGHVNGGGSDGIFVRLDELTTGDQVLVTRDDATTAVFTVTSTEQIPKAEFPTDAVYGDTDSAELRLITCGGSFDDEASSYRDNIIVFAELTGVR
ncbi:MAG: class F sortase [Pseudonocardiaceae bacterium]